MYPIDKINAKLEESIQHLAQHRSDFSRTPQDFTRQRKLPFEKLLHFLISLESSNFSRELFQYFHYDEQVPSVSALVQQRQKLNDKAFPTLFYSFTNTLDAPRLFRGYRLIACDGSDLNIPRNPNDKETYFEQGYNQLHLNALFDVLNQLYVGALIQPARLENERQAEIEMLQSASLPSKTIVLSDRGYESYHLFESIKKQGYHYLIRVKNTTSSTSLLKSFKLPDESFDTTVTRLLTRRATREIRAHPEIYKRICQNQQFDLLPQKSLDTYPFTLRVLQFPLDSGRMEALVTDLPESELSMQEAKTLYALRWGIETSFRELKYTVGLSYPHAIRREFNEQEVFARLILFNLGSAVIQEEAKHMEWERGKAIFISYKNGLQICRDFLLGRIASCQVGGFIKKYYYRQRKKGTNERNIRAKRFVSFAYRF